MKIFRNFALEEAATDATPMPEVETVNAEVAEQGAELTEMTNAMEEALTEIQDQQTVGEKIDETIESGEGLSPGAAELVEASMERFARKFGLDYTRTLPAKEDAAKDAEGQQQAAKDAGEKNKGLISKAIDAIKRFFGWVWDKLVAFWKKIKEFFAWVKKKAIEYYNKIKNFGKKLYYATKGAVIGGAFGVWAGAKIGWTMAKTENFGDIVSIAKDNTVHTDATEAIKTASGAAKTAAQAAAKNDAAALEKAKEEMAKAKEQTPPQAPKPEQGEDKSKSSYLAATEEAGGEEVSQATANDLQKVIGEYSSFSFAVSKETEKAANAINSEIKALETKASDGGSDVAKGAIALLRDALTCIYQADVAVSRYYTDKASFMLRELDKLKAAQ